MENTTVYVSTHVHAISNSNDWETVIFVFCFSATGSEETDQKNETSTGNETNQSDSVSLINIYYSRKYWTAIKFVEENVVKESFADCVLFANYLNFGICLLFEPGIDYVGNSWLITNVIVTTCSNCSNSSMIFFMEALQTRHIFKICF